MTDTGRRERKKARTRRALDEAALRLFLEHGYDHVTVARIADEADVSVATLFAHVPDGKEALIFDDGTERREGVVAAVRDRAPGEEVLTALHRFFASRGPFAAQLPPELERKRALIVNTPALRGYARRLWIACEVPLAEAIAEAGGLDATDPSVRALARFVLEIPDLTGADPDPLAALATVFGHLARGWPANT
ncbi:TetR/AcrR family transcriptional regulator [Amycolatopsis sp. NPDC051903]|uniref:TetR/AcrR family transcriptional regulator n=1 Tax=Amycolatopsis sp. NPDC051903 TaxID=3363936 RepID=UPI0037BBCFC6